MLRWSNKILHRKHRQTKAIEIGFHAYLKDKNISLQTEVKCALYSCLIISCINIILGLDYELGSSTKKTLTGVSLISTDSSVTKWCKKDYALLI